MTRMKKFCKQILAQGTKWFLVALLSIALVLTACTPVTPPPPPPPIPIVHVFDDLGRLVVINGTPRRIISLAPSNTEILFALGLGGKVVGVTDFCNYPPGALNKTRVGGFVTPSIEKIVALNPDLILAKHGNPRAVIDTLAGLGRTVFGIRTTDLDDLLHDIRRVGEITDRRLEALALTSRMESRIQAVTNLTANLTVRPRVLYIMWHDPLWTAGSGTFIHELIERAGGVNIARNITRYTIISIEEVVARDPEIIITSKWSFNWTLNATALANTTARRTGRIHTLHDDLVMRPGPRLVKGLEWFAHFIHPAIFVRPIFVKPED